MKRQILIATAATALSVAGVAALLGLWRLISYLAEAYMPQVAHTPAQTDFGVFAIMTLIVAALAAGLTSAGPVHIHHRMHRGQHGFHRMRFRH